MVRFLLFYEDVKLSVSSVETFEVSYQNFSVNLFACVSAPYLCQSVDATISHPNILHFYVISC